MKPLKLFGEGELKGIMPIPFEPMATFILKTQKPNESRTLQHHRQQPSNLYRASTTTQHLESNAMNALVQDQASWLVWVSVPYYLVQCPSTFFLNGAILFISIHKRHSWWTCIHSAVSWSLGNNSVAKRPLIRPLTTNNFLIDRE